MKKEDVTGIGHEQDFTLCDFVSDLRAPTPTGAVELITPNINDVYTYLDNLLLILETSLNNKLFKYKNNLSLYENNKYLKNGNLLIEKEILKLDYYNQKLLNFKGEIDKLRLKNEHFEMMLNNKIKNILVNTNKEIEVFENLLKAYSVDNVLRRGFSITYKNGKLIKKSKDLKLNDEVDLKMFDGTKKARVV